MVFQLLANGFVGGCLYAILAVSFGLIYNTTRTLHIAHGGTYTAGAYLCYLFLVQCDTPLWAAAGLAVLLSAVLGMGMELIIYAPLARRGGSPLVAFLSSLGLYVAIVNIVALFFGNETKVLRPGIEKAYHFGSVILTSTQLAQILVALVLLPAFVFFLRMTIWGKVILAVRDSQELASVIGINVQYTRIGVFALGSGMAGLAAVLAALNIGMDPQAGMPALLTAAVALIVGGVGTFEGPILGGFLLGLLQSLMVWKFSARWTDTMTFLVLILVLIFRPSGIAGRRLRVEENEA